MTTETQPPRRATVRAPAKINLCLRIVGLRPDGYHLLDSIMVPVSLFDRLRIEILPGDSVAIEGTTNVAHLKLDDTNLVTRAARLFCAQTGLRGTIKIILDKEIPIGAGLGGGSSDAAATLVGLNHLCGNMIDPPTLMAWGAELGADVPFFVCGRPARVRGIGEVVEGLDGLEKRPILLAFPGVGLSTAEVYRQFDRSLTSRAEVSRFWPFADGRTPLREILVNDLEAVASRMCPPVAALRQRLIERGAVAALMTGSGSAVFGVWNRHDEAIAAAEELRVRDGMWAQVVEMLDRTPDVETETRERES